MNFRESTEYLLSLGNEVSAMKLGLESMTRLLAALGDPQKNYLKVQVAGTNGKGSVCAFLESICMSAGIRTGVTTSPHLISITERVRIDGKNIGEDEFARLTTNVRATSERLVADGELETIPTYFEQVTAVALVAFAEAQIELAIVETGLGGRLDATTSAHAEIAAITRIDLDHQQYLGETISAIAAEKAAIIGAASEAVLIGEQPSEAMEVIFDRCRSVGVIPRTTADVRTICSGSGLRFETQNSAYAVDELGLRGRHQIENATVAILVAESLQKHFSITRENIVAGLRSARHPGRLEHIDRFLLDGAHNPSGAAALVAYIEDIETRVGAIIFGAMRDKDVESIAKTLFPKADVLILTRIENSRSLSASEIAGRTHESLGQRVRLTDSVNEAIDVAIATSPSDALIIVTGSLYLVGEARSIILSQGKSQI
jgi:dihydrofolate synthase/folylpolyglutamate synthase